MITHPVGGARRSVTLNVGPFAGSSVITVCPPPIPPRSPAPSVREKSTQRGNKGLELMDVNEFSRIRLSGGECNLLVNTGP